MITSKRHPYDRAIVVSKNGIKIVPAKPPDKTWIAIDSFAKELESSGVSPEESLRLAKLKVVGA